MKKIVMITMIALVAAGMIGCAQEFESANITWNNQSSKTVSDIKWEDEAGNVNTAWTGETVNHTFASSEKTVTQQTGKGTCFESGSEYEILINDSNARSYSLTDGASEVLKINGFAAKK